MKKVAIYCRLARKDFWGMRLQKQELRQFAKNLGYDDYILFADNGESGNTLDRPAFSKLDKAIQGGAVDTVIMRDISRIGRNHLLTCGWLDKVEKAGVELVFLHDSQPLQKIDFTSIINSVR